MRAGYKLDGPPLPPPLESKDGLRFLLTGTGGKMGNASLLPQAAMGEGLSAYLLPGSAPEQEELSRRLPPPPPLSFSGSPRPKVAAVIPPSTRREGLASREPFSPAENAWGNVPPRLLHAGSLLLLGRKRTCSVDAGPITLLLE